MGTRPPKHPQFLILMHYYFIFSDPAAWLEYKAHSATMLTSTREYN